MSERHDGPRGGARFHGKPCRRCGGTERFAASRNCVPCVTLAYRKRGQRRGGAGAHFVGDACAKCGHNLRYASSGVCVTCDRARAKAKREVAKQSGVKTYDGNPCSKCGGTLRRFGIGDCVACARASARRSRRKSREENPRHHWCSSMWSNYRISAREYDEMFKVQAGVCGICAQPEVEGRRLAVDHEHSAAGTVRALLCFRCNTSLGKLREDPEIFERAIAYLRRSRR